MEGGEKGGRGRGRPRRSAGQEQAVRERVVDAARGLFALEGFEAVSMRRIAQQAGCSTMSLYGYFRSKNDLLRHIWEDFFAELFARVEAALALPTPEQRLRDACAAYVNYWCEHPERYRMVYLNQDQAAAGEQLYVDASPIVERFGLFRELVQAAQDSGAARPGDPQLLGEALVCSLLGLCHSLVTIPEYPWRPRAQLLQAALGLVLREPADRA
ncbi:TetR/AcrR family transcriptional regulator [Solimonas sp. K1W22B-7]|uniref:TetR/AcrR family transcriptional regulator n=1 Tax=Solimonas sp. K1W22B-7 TaxID=2303331 RepID=UPI000E337C31|nr:TetR/AcrR family transcriptional regulator [Solimonas sp. K1W22B-7]AXQ29933.1 TetR/AcrR family transcriptional regulator [Solimonas sp. K1W22B-7]